MTATLKYACSSEKKLGVIAKMIRGKSVPEAETILRYLPKRAANILAKVVHSAAANAQHNAQLKPEQLYVKIVELGKGPKIRRVRPVGRSRMYGYNKQRTFVKVVLDVK